VQHLDGVDFITAVQTLNGHSPANNAYRPRQVSNPAKTDVIAYEQRQREKAQWLWQNRKQISGSPAEAYLRNARGYTGPIPPTLAYLSPSRPQDHPALISAFALVDEIEPGVLANPRNADAVHLTLLRADGTGKAAVENPKLVVGRPLGRPIVLAPPNDLLGLGVTEGIEDGLTVYQETGLRVWAAYSASNMPNLGRLVPDYVEAVTIYAHDDENGAGQRGAQGLADLLFQRGIEVRIEGLGP
jgi:putative DNA primase/helicase